jgi:cell division protein ZapE
MNNSLPASDGGISPKEWYQGLSAQNGFVHDTAQSDAIDQMDILWRQLLEFKSKRNRFLGRSLLSTEVPKGLYLWGGVGRGKTFLMDAFYNGLPYRRKWRIHFHSFMAEIHHEMSLLIGEPDPLIILSDRIAQSTRLLCLDEFHVDDIADAMILGRLLEAILNHGVVLIATSNYSPDTLYPNGLQRQNFLMTIDLLKQYLKIVHVDSGTDYRLLRSNREPLFLVSDHVRGDAENEACLAQWFERISDGTQLGEEYIVVHGRHITVKKVACNVAWFDFKELCSGNHSQEDYLEIAHRFPTLILSHISRMHDDNADTARRFTWLIDVLYDNNVRLIASSAAPPDEIYVGAPSSNEISRTISRLSEMQSQHYLQLPHHSEDFPL